MTLRIDFISPEYFRNPAAGIERLRASGPVIEIKSRTTCACRLIAPLAVRVRTGGAYCLAFHPGQPKPARVQAFEDWIVKQAADVESRFPQSKPVPAQPSLA